MSYQYQAKIKGVYYFDMTGKQLKIFAVAYKNGQLCYLIQDYNDSANQKCECDSNNINEIKWSLTNLQDMLKILEEAEKKVINLPLEKKNLADAKEKEREENPQNKETPVFY
ncbi:MAG TPA: hypothetical protein VJA83_00370 [Sulfuricurvum sp.]|nr:hypothetical protein [Sulfuricurvum sp.]